MHAIGQKRSVVISLRSLELYALPVERIEEPAIVLRAVYDGQSPNHQQSHSAGPREKLQTLL